MRKQFLLCAIAMGMASPAMAAPWVRGYVVDNYEPAFYYGAKTGTEAPGSDCPKGTIGDNDYSIVLKTKWRTPEQIAAVVNPPGVSPGQIHNLVERAITYRGFRPDIETYINPFGAPDPGMQEVTGKIAEGFDLDGNARTGGFTSVSGEKGIDNAYYRAIGCIMSYRGTPYSAYLSRRGNDKMLEGLYTMVIRMSGNKDPMNDDDVTFEIGYSPDHIVKGTDGRAVSDYSFRLFTGAEYTKMKAKIKNGVIETEQVAKMQLPEFSWFPANSGEADFQKGRIRMAVDADGNVSGLIGGYRDWRVLFAKDTWNQGQPEPNSATTRETLYHENQIGMYYALKRNADAMPDPKTGQNTAISIAYRFKAVPAFVVDPTTPIGIEIPEDEKNRIYMAQTLRDLFYKATTTKIIQKEPFLPQERRPGGRGGAAPNGAPPQNTPAPPKGGQQVNNVGSATVASARLAPAQ